MYRALDASESFFFASESYYTTPGKKRVLMLKTQENIAAAATLRSRSRTRQDQRILPPATYTGHAQKNNPERASADRD